jgi:rhodanese-related sulfurtransferase
LLSRRAFLALSAGTLISAGIGYRRVYPSFDGPAIDAPTAFERAKAGGVVLVDIRRPDEWRATGVGVGAHPIDLRDPNFIDDLSDLVNGDRNRPIALICARGVRSARIANLLTDNGFSMVINVPEGMLGSSDGPGWVARGLPLQDD